MDISMVTSFVVWSIDPELVDFGAVQIRWYGLLFALGFLIGYYIVAHVYKTEGHPEEQLDSLLIYMVVAIVVGARLGHCLFYQPDFYLSNPLEILKVWKGGLASHGAGIGTIIALYLFARKHSNMTFFWLADRIILTIALGAGFIRAGNLFNSEIYGVKTNAPYGFVYARSAVDVLQASYGNFLEDLEVAGTGKDTTVQKQDYTQVRFSLTFAHNINERQAQIVAEQRFYALLSSYEEPSINFKQFGNQTSYDLKQVNGKWHLDVYLWGVPRHPTQIYESGSAFILFFILIFLWNRYKAYTPPGLMAGLFLVYVFGLRVFWETLKLNQVDFEEGMALNMGQWLSFPMIAFGLFMVYYALTHRDQIPANKD